jgi:hypothetical protein
MKVVVKATGKRKTKSEYKGLTYDFMRRFIRVLDIENIVNFELAKGHFEDIYDDSSVVYHCVKDWFLNKYPRYKEMVVDTVPSTTDEPNIIEVA